MIPRIHIFTCTIISITFSLFIMSTSVAQDMTFYDPTLNTDPVINASTTAVNVSVDTKTPLLKIPSNFYGINIHPGSSEYEVPRPELLNFLKPDAVRIMTVRRSDWLPNGQQVSPLSPSEGVIDWSKLDKLVTTVVDARAQPYLAFGFGPPQWMSGATGLNERLPPLDQNYQKYADFMADITRHYTIDKKIPIKRVTVDNEPENSSYSIDNYAKLAKLAYTSIKAANPQVSVGGPVIGYAQWTQPDGTKSGFSQSLTSLNSKNVPFDFIDWHIYATSATTVLSTVDAVQKVYGKLKPLVISELNLDWRYNNIDAQVNNTSWNSISWLAYLYDNLQIKGVSQTFYFGWRENTLGLVDSKMSSLRPNYYLIWAMTNYLGRERVKTTISDPSVGCIATNDFGKLRMLIYNRAASSVIVKLPTRKASLEGMVFDQGWFDANSKITTALPALPSKQVVPVSATQLNLPAGGFVLLGQQ